jgi:hypothetical protein
MLYSIISKPWFTRVWVLHELVFSSNPWIQCGKIRAKWQMMYDALEKISPSFVDLSQSQRCEIICGMERAWKGHRKFESRLDMVELVSARRGLGVSDPRDRVFAHIGFSADGRNKNLLVDYCKTCAQVYTDFALHISMTGGFLLLLDELTEKQSCHTIQDLPSWVPDWTSDVPGPAKFYSEYRMELLKPPIHIVDLVQGSPIPTATVRHSETIWSTSLPLSLSQVSEYTRPAIASRLANLKIEFKTSVRFWIEYGNIDAANDIWAEVYPIWRRIVEDDEILGQEIAELSESLENLPETSRSRDGVMSLSLTIYLQLLFAFASDTTFNSNYITGSALARTTGGKLALVSTSAQQGDVIITLSDEKERSQEYVVRPMQQVHNHIGDDAKLRELLHKAYEWKLDWPVLHCELISDCLLEVDFDRLDSYMYMEHPPFILALH